jgi:CrcB protein
MMFVFLAGGAGATLRVALAAAVEHGLGERLPNVGVLLANLIGCLLIGLMTVVLPTGPWRTVVLGGFLGGFTTYSAFALFTVELAQDARYGVVGAQLALHLVGGVIAVLVGIAIGRALGLGA